MQNIPSRRHLVTALLCLVACITGGLLLLLSVLNSAESAAAKSSSPGGNSAAGCSYAWREVSSQSPGTLANYLNDVSVISSTNIWTVGSYSSGSGYHTLVQHWDGTTWSIVSSPSSGSDDQLYGVDAVSANDIWAVGSYFSGRSHSQVLHWNGTAWSSVASPDDGHSSFYLESVSAIAANNVWAVGFYQTGSSPDQTFVIHWDGTAWSTVTSANFGTYDNVLLGMAVAAPNDIWAVGYYGTGGPFQWQPLIERWNGTQWSVVSSPTSGTSTLLNGIEVISAGDVWAVGSSAGSGPSHTLTEHWNGTSWSIVNSPNVGTYDNYFQSVKAVASDDVWAVGDYYTGGPFQTLTAHWDGATWTIVDSPTFPSFQNELRAIDIVSANDFWAVGIADPNTLTEHYSYECQGGTVTPSPTGVSTSTTTPGPSTTPSASPSSTATVTATIPGTQTTAPTQTAAASGTPTSPAATATATSTTVSATPTVCTIVFSDVPAGSTFYSYIECLACRGLINGYPDGTFRPNNDVTRGQLAKIVSNAAGFEDTPNGQQYQDVPVGSTFYSYVYRLSSRGYIGGYPCGGPGEPCEAGDLPYFRTNSSATRGQISKIVSNAAGFTDIPSGQQFEDVAVDSTFYSFVYRLVSRQVMSGYPCGAAPAGQCVPPSNLPYFLPSNNATRGQTSKIVSNTFFPNCSPASDR